MGLRVLSSLASNMSNSSVWLVHSSPTCWCGPGAVGPHTLPGSRPLISALPRGPGPPSGASNTSTGGPINVPSDSPASFPPPKPKLPLFQLGSPPPPPPPLPTTGPAAGLSSAPALGHCPWGPCLNHFITHSNTGTQMQCDILEQRTEIRGKPGKIRTKP